MPIVSESNAIFGHRSLVESMKGYPAPIIQQIYPYFDQYGYPSLQQNQQMQLGIAGTSTPPHQNSYIPGAFDIQEWHQFSNNEAKSLKRKLANTQLPVSKIRRKSKAIKRVQKSPKRHVKSFPQKLMKSMMTNPNEDAVAWLPDGKSFVVVNPVIFSEKVLKKVFLKESKYSSFVRKLNRWGFVRLTSGTGMDCFHHPLFRKNRPDLATLMSCTPRMSNARNGVDSAVIAAGLEKDTPPSLAGIDKFLNQQSPTMISSSLMTQIHVDGESQDEKKNLIAERD